jgi:uncharacterized membrane protein YcaP (DUF421 family)
MELLKQLRRRPVSILLLGIIIGRFIGKYHCGGMETFEIIIFIITSLFAIYIITDEKDNNESNE